MADTQKNKHIVSERSLTDRDFFKVAQCECKQNLADWSLYACFWGTAPEIFLGYLAHVWGGEGKVPGRKSLTTVLEIGPARSSGLVDRRSLICAGGKSESDPGSVPEEGENATRFGLGPKAPAARHKKTGPPCTGAPFQGQSKGLRLHRVPKFLLFPDRHDSQKAHAGSEQKPG